MTEVNPPGFLQNAGSVHTAEILREPFNALIAGKYSASFGQRARGGVHPTLGLAFAVSQNGTPNMSVNVGSGHAFVPGSEGATQGCYLCFNDGTVNKSVAAADPSLPRIDIVVAKVQDSFYSGSTNSWSIAVVTGTPNSTPVAPAAPNNSITLAQIAVAAGATSIVTANITDARPFLTAQGGIIPVRSLAERDALLGTYGGFAVWRIDSQIMQIHNGAGGFLDFPGEVALRPLRYAKTLDESLTSNATLQDDDALVSISLGANTVWKVDLMCFYTATGTGTTGGIQFGWSAPSGATLDWIPYSKIDSDSFNAATSVWLQKCTLSDVVKSGGASAAVGFVATGELAIGATPGPLKFRWAQAASNVAATTVKAGSRLYLRRVG